MKKYLDAGSIIVIAITFLLFSFALFTKGLTTICYWRLVFYLFQ